MTLHRDELNRRQFLGRAGAAAGLGLAGLIPANAVQAAPGRNASANDKLVLGLIGCGGMGAANMRTLLDKPGVAVAALCDVDDSRVPGDAAYVEKKQGRKPDIYKDFRKVLERKD